MMKENSANGLDARQQVGTASRTDTSTGPTRSKPVSAARRGRGRLGDFQSQLGLNPQVISEISSWSGENDLGHLHRSLIAHSNKKTFLDRYVEAMIARHLLQHDCPFTMDVQTPNGRSADFQVHADGYLFYLHVKRLISSRRPNNGAAFSSRVRYLEQIDRPFIVRIRWNDAAMEHDMQHFVEGASRFLQRAHIGDEYVARDDQRHEIGAVRVTAPWKGPNVKLLFDERGDFTDDVPRMHKLMQRAAKQFMPNASNVVVICSEHERNAHDFETALLGTHIERWDVLPPRGQRIAHGRASDGCWHGGRRADWKAGVWAHFSPGAESLQTRLWLRGDMGLPTQVMRRLIDLFGSV